MIRLPAFTSCTLARGGTIVPCDKVADDDWPRCRTRTLLARAAPWRSLGSCGDAYDAPYRVHEPNRRA